jgi:hypothetical protein
MIGKGSTAFEIWFVFVLFKVFWDEKLASNETLLLESLKGGFSRAGTKRPVRNLGILANEMFVAGSAIKNCKNVKQPEDSRMCGGCVIMNSIILLLRDLNTENMGNIEQGLAEYELPACSAWTDEQLIKAVLVVSEDVLLSKHDW